MFFFFVKKKIRFFSSSVVNLNEIVFGNLKEEGKSQNKGTETWYYACWKVWMVNECEKKYVFIIIYPKYFIRKNVVRGSLLCKYSDNAGEFVIDSDKKRKWQEYHHMNGEHLIDQCVEMCK